MKLKEYFNSLVSRRKSSTASSKPDHKDVKTKSHHESASSTDCRYEVYGYEDANRLNNTDQHSRTQILLTRHAELVDTIVGIRSQNNPYTPCRHCRSEQENLFLNRNYSNTLATSNPRRECHHQAYSLNPTIISSSNNSLWNKTRQRSRIRTNPWIKTSPVDNQILQPEYSICDSQFHPSSSELIHSESFTPSILNSSMPPTNIILHQSDSGHGFSLSSSSSPDETGSDGPVIEKKQHIPSSSSRMNTIEQYPSNSLTRQVKKPIQSGYQRPSNTSSIDRIRQEYHSPHFHNDHFSIEFEEIVENERLHKQRSSKRKSPFILPLDEPNVTLSSPPPILYSTTLTKTNSRTILKHIEEIENEIQMIKNLNLDHDEYIHSPQVVCPDQDQRQSIHEQVDQWVDECLTTNNNPVTFRHTEGDCLSNTTKDYVVCVRSNKNHESSSLPKPSKTTELMTAFYLSSIPTTKRTFSCYDQPLPLSQSETMTKSFKFIHECPF